MILECENCRSLVEAEVLHTYDGQNAAGQQLRYTLAKCSTCDGVLLACAEHGDSFDGEWQPAARLYPPPHKQLSAAIPMPIRSCYTEAQVCFKAKAFTASALMCRKALKGLCAALGGTARGLALGLKELRDRGVVEARLFEWAEALGILGNEAAQDVHVTVSAADAGDILEFTEAAIESSFIYRDKFEQFQIRRGNQGLKPSTR